MRGYYIGAVDGSVGSKTREAIEMYQRAHRQAITGKPSRGLYQELEDYALELKGLRQFRAGDYEEAAGTYAVIIQRQPQNANAYFNRGLSYRNAGLLALAMDDYDVALRLDPDHRKAFMDRANVRYRQGRYREAIRDYFQAMKLWLDLS